MKKSTYNLICRTCGQVFYASHARVNCPDCGKVRNAGAAAKELECRHNKGELITSDTIAALAKSYSCSRSGLYTALRRIGWVSTSIWQPRVYAQLAAAATETSDTCHSTKRKEVNNE